MPTTATDRAPEANPAVSPQEASNEKTKERLMGNVKIADTPHPRLGTPCWNHSGCKANPCGHRNFQYKHDGVTERYAHRASYRIHRGEIPSGMHVLHQCDNPACVNPAHLELGTHQKNMADKALRGPSRAKSGIKGVYQNGNGWRAKVTSRGMPYTFFHSCKETVVAWVEAMRQQLHGHNPAAPLASGPQLALF